MSPDRGRLGPRHLSGQVCKLAGDQAAACWAPCGVWASWCRSSCSRRSARSLVVNFHGNDGQLPNGETLPLMRLRYCGSAARWGLAMHLYSTQGYEDAVLPTGAFAGLPEDALDCAAGLYLSDLTP